MVKERKVEATVTINEWPNTDSLTIYFGRRTHISFLRRHGNARLQV